MFHTGDAVRVVKFQVRPKWLIGFLEDQIVPLNFRVCLEDGHLWKRNVDHIRLNIPTKPVVRGSEEASQLLRSRGQMFKRHSTSVTQLPILSRPMQDWEMIFPKSTTKHVYTIAKGIQEGTKLKVKPKCSSPSRNWVQRGNDPVPDTLLRKLLLKDLHRIPTLMTQ